MLLLLSDLITLAATPAQAPLVTTGSPPTPISFDDFVAQMSGELTSNTSGITNLRPGSIALAIIKAVAGCGMSLQQLLAYIYSTERLATCTTYSDAVSFVADFGMTPKLAVAAYGSLQCNRQLTGGELLVQPGSLVQTKVNSIQFEVIADTTQSAWDSVREVYVFPPTVSQIVVTVQATPTFIGSIGNVTPGPMSIVSGLSGVNTVTLPTQLNNGADQESLAALKARFPRYLKSLKTSNTSSIELAIENVQANLSYQIMQYVTFAGGAFPSGFTVVVDDGSGNAAPTFLTAVYNAIDAVRAAGAKFAVAKPNNVAINVTLTVTPNSGASLTTVQANVTQAIMNYVNLLGVGVLVNYADLSHVIGATPGVFSYTGVLVNGGAINISIGQTQLARFGMTTYV